MNRNGFRSQPQASKKEAQRQIEVELQNLQMASRVGQMMTQQLLQNVKNMSQDLSSSLNQLFELQYKVLAIQKHLNLDATELNNIANQQRLTDFDEASSKADKEENLIISDVATNDSTIVITSTATDEKGNDSGIFRSRIKLSESGVPDLISALTGKTVGQKVDVTLNGVKHQVELLSVRNPPNIPETGT